MATKDVMTQDNATTSHRNMDIQSMISQDDETTSHVNAAFEAMMHIKDEMLEMMHDAYGFEFSQDVSENVLTPTTRKFHHLVVDAKHELYPDCKEFTKLTFIVKLFHINCQYQASNNA